MILVITLEASWSKALWFMVYGGFGLGCLRQVSDVSRDALPRLPSQSMPCNLAVEKDHAAGFRVGSELGRLCLFASLRNEDPITWRLEFTPAFLSKRSLLVSEVSIEGQSDEKSSRTKYKGLIV